MTVIRKPVHVNIEHGRDRAWLMVEDIETGETVVSVRLDPNEFTALMRGDVVRATNKVRTDD